MIKLFTIFISKEKTYFYYSYLFFNGDLCLHPTGCRSEDYLRELLSPFHCISKESNSGGQDSQHFHQQKKVCFYHFYHCARPVLECQKHFLYKCISKFFSPCCTQIHLITVLAQNVRCFGNAFILHIIMHANNLMELILTREKN